MRKLLALLLAGSLCALGCGGPESGSHSKSSLPSPKDMGKPPSPGGIRTPPSPSGKPITEPDKEKPEKPEKPEPPKKEGSIKLLPSDAVTVEKGKSAKVPVKVARKDYDGPITVKAEVPAGSGLKIKDVTIPAGKDSADLEVDAEATAKVAADVSVTVTVSGKDVKEDSEKIKVTVK